MAPDSSKWFQVVLDGLLVVLVGSTKMVYGCSKWFQAVQDGFKGGS